MSFGTDGKVVTGTVLGTTAAINVSVGFKPRYVQVLNTDGSNEAIITWYSSMAADKGLKTLAAGTTDYVSSGGITQWDGLAARGALSGTAAVTAASVTVTGTSTYFQNELAVGDKIEINGEQREVASIASQTSLTVTKAFDASASGKSILAIKGRPEGFTIGTDANVNADGDTLVWVAMP